MPLPSAALKPITVGSAPTENSTTGPRSSSSTTTGVLPPQQSQGAQSAFASPLANSVSSGNGPSGALISTFVSKYSAPSPVPHAGNTIITSMAETSSPKSDSCCSEYVTVCHSPVAGARPSSLSEIGSSAKVVPSPLSALNSQVDSAFG